MENPLWKYFQEIEPKCTKEVDCNHVPIADGIYTGIQSGYTLLYPEDSLKITGFKYGIRGTVKRDFSVYDGVVNLM